MAKDKKDSFKSALVGKQLPILTLDNKWYQLFPVSEGNKEVKSLEKELNELLKRQGKLNNEMKQVRKLKAKLMDEIVTGMNSDEQKINMEDHKRLINDCNEKLDAMQDELLDIPKEIEHVNYELMIKTMDICYETIAENTTEINEIADWISGIRVELKKNVIRKQEKELLNQELYSYMHDIFGPEVIEIFDMKYDPSESMLKKSERKDNSEDRKENEHESAANKKSDERG